MTEPSQYFKGRTVQEQMNEVIGYVDTRAAEVATDAIASDVAQVHQDMLDADADASAAAASAAAAAGTLANAVKKTGETSQSIAGDITVIGDLTGGTVTVPTPVNNTDAANKKYVDDADALKVSITDINSYAVGLTGNQTNILGNKGFMGNIFNGMVKRLWCGYPNPSVWTEVFRYNTTSDVYLNIEFYDTASHYMHVIGLCDSSTPNLFIVATANTPTGYGVAIAQEDGDTIVYIKTMTGRNHAVTITAHDRLRNPFIFTPTSDASTTRATLPTISANVIA